MGKKKEQPAVSQTSGGIPAEFAPFLKSLIGDASAAFQTNKTNATPDFGPAAFNSVQTEAQNSILNLSQGPLQDFTNTFLDTATSNLTNFLDPNNAVVQNAADAANAPVLRAFNEQVRPTLRGDAQRTGNVGSSREGIAESRTNQALLETLANNSATVTNSAFQKGLDTMIATLGLAPGLQSSAVFPSLTANAVGEQRQQQDQAGKDADVQTTLFDQNKDDVAIANFANILFGIPGGQSTTTQQAARGASGGAGSAISSGLSGASLGFKVGGPWGAAIGGGLGILSSIF